MNLLEQPFLIVDGQTTGMRPPRGQLLELGWSFTAASEDAPVVASQIFRLAEGQWLDRKISEITGLNATDLEGKPEPKPWFGEFFCPWIEDRRPRLVIAHYAQFEKPFVDQFVETDLTYLCTQQLTKRLFPDLPSQNIRAVSGYFGHPMTGKNRAGEFVFATFAIWRGLAARLKELGITTLQELEEWKKTETPKAKKKTISYRIPAELRLNLPDCPGIYKMLAKNGAILYVGKATSLKSRVNSYFRGVKNRDKRKLEMLAQVWDLKVETCGSPLEAALRETDEIKRLDPPYNVSLKKNQRQLCFYSEDFMSASTVQSEEFPRGPFRPGNFIEMVTDLWKSLESGEFEQIFFDPIDTQVMEEGFELFLERNHYPNFRSLRSLLAYGLNLFRHFEEPEIPVEDDTEAEIDEEEDVEVTPDYVAGKFERLLRRAGAEIDRAKRFTAALDATVEFKVGDDWRQLHFRNGMYNSWPQEEYSKKLFPWSGLDIETYDRLSVLLSELNRLEHRILRHS